MMPEGEAVPEEEMIPEEETIPEEGEREAVTPEGAVPEGEITVE